MSMMSSLPAGAIGHVSHRDRSPVFVIGHARSGTTILTKLIRQHLRIAFGTESQFIVRVGMRVRSFGNLQDDTTRRRLVDALAAERFFVRTARNYGFTLDRAAAVQASQAGTYSAVLGAVFDQLASHMGCERWGDKTPEYALDLPVIYGLFPGARFVHVVRDGRDVALSVFETQFGAKNAFTAARDWRASLAAVDRFRQAFADAPLLDVRYEDLLSDPEVVFQRLIVFLGVDDDRGISGPIGAAVRQQVRAGNARKWKTRLSREEQQTFEAVAGEWLTRYGYERVYVAVEPPGAIATLRWTADDLLKRARRGGFWRDSLYRLGLRLGAAGGPLRRFGTSRKPRASA